MIIVSINGGLAQQLGQYAFGLACAAHLATTLKLDAGADPRPPLLDLCEAELANSVEVAALRAAGAVTEADVASAASIWHCVRDNVYLDGVWHDAAYGAASPVSAGFPADATPAALLLALLARSARQPRAASGPAPAAADLLARAAATSRPDLVVMIGYGNELPVFRNARALWQFYASHFPNIQIVFTRWSEQLAFGEVVSDGDDLVVGIRGDRFGSAEGYAASGVWSQSENAKWIFRQTMVQDYLLRTRIRPFFLYQTTATSVVDFRGLSTALDNLPATGCYAGPMARLNAPEQFNGLTFVSGASALMSRDVMVRLRERYDPEEQFAALPVDVWQSLLLQDVPRIALPTFNFLKQRAPRAQGAAIFALAQRLLRQGQYHFRVKTVAPEDAASRREDIDPWIMLRIMEAVLSTEPSPAATLELMGKVQRMTDGANGAPLPSRTATRLHMGPRDFPLNDMECSE